MIWAFPHVSSLRITSWCREANVCRRTSWFSAWPPSWDSSLFDNDQALGEKAKRGEGKAWRFWQHFPSILLKIARSPRNIQLLEERLTCSKFSIKSSPGEGMCHQWTVTTLWSCCKAVTQNETILFKTTHTIKNAWIFKTTSSGNFDTMGKKNLGIKSAIGTE